MSRGRIRILNNKRGYPFYFMIDTDTEVNLFYDRYRGKLILIQCMNIIFSEKYRTQFHIITKSTMYY